MFDANKSLEDNLAIYRIECEKIDADCAKILFDNIDNGEQPAGDQRAVKRAEQRLETPQTEVVEEPRAVDQVTSPERRRELTRREQSPNGFANEMQPGIGMRGDGDQSALAIRDRSIFLVDERDVETTPELR